MNINKTFSYPLDFFDYSKGVKINDNYVNGMVDKVLVGLETCDDCMISTGNTLVIGYRDENGDIEIIVAKDFKTYPILKA